ncbi:hypothetical protein [Pseudochrobactrum sp. XF203]|uniref:hypothetical protein n=1 Tax=Pseudochrobactrum sp. XF203 TaxID=2879116 RepID=UPI001CE328C1|nr:hypothetical protein [Pseudochrobactrum sp. XF203]UCA46998.1 hypothetical protein LDL70_07305 [Pseudochrobactrum sp. XF203]
MHREEDKLWWTITKNEDYYILNEPARPPHITGPFISINKASQKWSDRSKKGVPLRLSSLPSLVVRSITNQSTQISPDREVAEFIIALINDHDVSPWTSKPKWTSDAKQSKKNPVTHFSPEQIAAYRMASTAFETVKKADGRTIESTAKIKNIIDFTEEELRKHVEDLISDQEGICALTELPLQFDTDLDDPELSASLDRIDSNGHYEKGNLQIVCKFANRWKGADDNSGFLRLMGLIKP